MIEVKWRTAMKIIHVFRILLVVIMVILPLVAVTPAFAGGLTHHHVVVPLDVIVPWYATAPDNPCGFDIYFHQWGNFRVNYWTDEMGRWVKEIDIYGNLKLIAGAGGNTIDIFVMGPVHLETTFPEENVAIVVSHTEGPSLMVTIPGIGKIWGGTGNLIETFTYDTNNPDEWILTGYSQDKLTGTWDWEDFSPVCDYLRP
jgi:hypothetical protein